MDEEDELIITLNFKEAFDIDFSDAYEEGNNKDYYKYLRPCYKI